MATSHTDGILSIADGSAWFLDNGDNQYRGDFRGGGVASGPIHLHRVSTGRCLGPRDGGSGLVGRGARLYALFHV